MAYTIEEKLPAEPHKLTLDDRCRLTMTGIKEVESFDEEMVVLYTTRGTLVIRGTGLHLQLLSLDSGQVHVDGTVESLTYEDTAPGTGGFFSRLFG
ncbi:MAG: sporulation protein YabP [Oscillospiraceae bacterium]|nr:sporulation protein YabP [Oscillospiraceae bacterium]